MKFHLVVTTELVKLPQFDTCLTFYTADNPKAPGSPPIGRGKTPAEAIGDWFVKNELVTWEIRP